MSEQKITLYWHIISQPGRAVKILLEMGKIPHEANHLDIFRLEHKKPEFMAVNPMGKIPFMTSNDFKLSESSAMMVYIWEKYDSLPRSLYGQTPQERASVNQNMSWCQNIFRPAMVGEIFLKRDYGFRMRKPVPEKLVEIEHNKFLEAAQMLNKLLEGKQHVANNTLTLADIMLFCEVTTFTFYGKSQADYPNIDRWFKKIYAVPEIKEMTHQWFPFGKMFSQKILNIPISKGSL